MSHFLTSSIYYLKPLQLPQVPRRCWPHLDPCRCERITRQVQRTLGVPQCSQTLSAFIQAPSPPKRSRDRRRQCRTSQEVKKLVVSHKLNIYIDTHTHTHRIFLSFRRFLILCLLASHSSSRVVLRGIHPVCLAWTTGNSLNKEVTDGTVPIAKWRSVFSVILRRCGWACVYPSVSMGAMFGRILQCSKAQEVRSIALSLARSTNLSAASNGVRATCLLRTFDSIRRFFRGKVLNELSVCVGTVYQTPHKMNTRNWTQCAETA